MNRRNNEKSVTEVTCYWKKVCIFYRNRIHTRVKLSHKLLKAPRLKRIGQEKLKSLSLLYGKTESDEKLPPGKITNIKDLLFDSIKLDTLPCKFVTFEYILCCFSCNYF